MMVLLMMMMVMVKMMVFPCVYQVRYGCSVGSIGIRANGGINYELSAAEKTNKKQKYIYDFTTPQNTVNYSSKRYEAKRNS